MQASRLIRSARRRHSHGDRSCLGVEITDFGLTKGVQNGIPIFLAIKVSVGVVRRELTIIKRQMLSHIVGIWSPFKKG